MDRSSLFLFLLRILEYIFCHSSFYTICGNGGRQSSSSTLAGEKMPDREQAPLAATLELIEYGVYHLNKIKFGGIASFAIER